MVGRTVFVLLAMILPCCTFAQGLFKEDEKKKIVAFWNAPGRYLVSQPEWATKTGPWQVRLTPEGSSWLLKYQGALGKGALPPTADPTTFGGGVQGWKEWVLAKVAYDRWKAQSLANLANSRTLEITTPKNDRRDIRLNALKPDPAMAPPTPGTIPASLLIAVGSPPSFASPVTPMRHDIRFEEGDSYSYQDNINFSPTYAYYRFSQGVAHEGTALTDDERTDLFKAAGLSDAEQHVMLRVSKLEGSFDAINTYDTGFVSVGFIQFASLIAGKGSLGTALQQEKTDTQEEFENDFRRFGIDVASDGSIIAIDPVSGVELSGTDAILKIIDEKRLIAVFQKAGKMSRAFRVAQIRVAKTSYWPADDPIKITLGGTVLEGKVSDAIQSEAGYATLFDRKVNRGSVAPFADVLLSVMKKHNLKAIPEALKYEREIIAQLKYRVDFLLDKDLKQPETGH